MNRRIILVGLVLATIIGAFIAEASFRHEVCVSAMATDTSTTIDYGEVCE